jgi:hypothetical protein
VCALDALGLKVKTGISHPRLLVIAPRDPTAEDLAGIFRSSLRNW